MKLLRDLVAKCPSLDAAMSPARDAAKNPAPDAQRDWSEIEDVLSEGRRFDAFADLPEMLPVGYEY